MWVDAVEGGVVTTYLLPWIRQTTLEVPDHTHSRTRVFFCYSFFCYSSTGVFVAAVVVCGRVGLVCLFSFFSVLFVSSMLVIVFFFILRGICSSS